MSPLDFKLIRSQDKEYIKEEILEQMKTNDFRLSIGYTDMRYSMFVQSIRRMAKMREIADEEGIGFAIFFQGPSGTRYCINNVNH